MPQLNNQPVLFTASGFLSAAQGPAGVNFPVNTGNNRARQYRISAVKTLQIGVAGAVQIYDDATNPPAPGNEIYESDKSETATNLAILCKAGDLYVKITGGYKVWLYLDMNK
jgi:hypothetical protein